MAAVRKIPMRMCIGCKEMKPKKEMLRIIKTKDGEIKLDATGKAAGRGAYICDSKACIHKCVKTRALNRAFSEDVPQEIYDAVKEEYAKIKN